MEKFIYKVLPAARMILSKTGLHVVSFYEMQDTSKIKQYLKKDSMPLLLNNCFIVEEKLTLDEKLLLIQKKISDGTSFHCICFEGFGCVLAGRNARIVFNLRDALKALLNNDIEASDNVYRSISQENDNVVDSLVLNKIAVITGGAQGFGEGIVRDLFAKQANVVIVDTNKDKGTALADDLNKTHGTANKALYVHCDISDELSVKNMIIEVVKNFGGIDVFISNAGILRAGDLDELDISTFELMTKINYSGYFICTKYASKIMKQQYQYAPEYFMDIIQINSKSGLRGSNKNYAYAGAKFGGIGLTQSFALELMPYNIKVNSICPGNFLDGPLWADPKNGLFVQYLNAGKVPGAKTIDDVKKYYENQVPTKRGCRVDDVMKAIYYVIDQKYETGQAIPVTGGQIMLK
jgi:NAD(P)-dependent dehydrogenase (short-subunit alcohol dehydrogenase family)